MQHRLAITICCALLAVPLLLPLTGCEVSAAKSADSATVQESIELPVGANCTIQFRRDALGANMSNPISPTTGSINGAEVSVHGQLKGINDDWVVITNGAREIWVPRDMVLLIQCQK